MPQPVVAWEPTLRQFVPAWGDVFSRPQWKYLVTGLLGLAPSLILLGGGQP